MIDCARLPWHGRHPTRPAIILDGGANALSVARSLGRKGVPVYVLAHPCEHVLSSRFARPLPVTVRDNAKSTWTDYLLGKQSEPLGGAVLLTGSDVGLQIIAENRAALDKKFVLDDSNPAVQMLLLDKLQTYYVARDAGVPTPRFWVVSTLSQVEQIKNELVFPLILKPLISHLFEQKFGRKFMTVLDHAALLQAFAKVEQAGIEIMLVEKLLGPDSLNCSYYTYLDECHKPLFDFTKRIFRRLPKNMGRACYHITDRNPFVKDLALKLIQHVKLRGLANVEFRLDRRDGQLKLIECNARFTAANVLLVDAGLDLPWFVYCRLTGRAPPDMTRYRAGLRLWDPLEDMRACRELMRLGDMNFFQWLKSVAHYQRMTYFAWDDPMPTLAALGREAKRYLIPRGE